MRTSFLGSFLSDVKKLRDAKTQQAVAAAIENVEGVRSIQEIRGVKRLSGHQHYFRIRVGDWRIGLIIENDVATFVRCLNRREIYRYFP